MLTASSVTSTLAQHTKTAAELQLISYSDAAAAAFRRLHARLASFMLTTKVTTGSKSKDGKETIIKAG